MSQLIDGGSSLYDTVVINKKSGTKITLDTDKKYVKKDIELTINAKEASPSFDGGELNNKTASFDSSNISYSIYDTSGILIHPKATAGRNAVLRDGGVDGWVNANDNAVILSAVDTTTWFGNQYYINGVNLGREKQFKISVPYNSTTITYYFSVDQNNVTHITADPPITERSPFEEMTYYGRCGSIVCSDNSYGKITMTVL